MPLNEAKKGPFWPHLISFNSILLAHAQTIPFFQRVFGAIHKDVLIYFRIHLIISKNLFFQNLKKTTRKQYSQDIQRIDQRENKRN